MNIKQFSAQFLKKRRQMKKLAIKYLALTFLGVAACSSANAADANDCRGNSPTLVLSGCSIIIAEGGVAAEDLAIAYSLRSNAYLTVGNYQKAIEDRLDALKLDPDNSSYKHRFWEGHMARGDSLVAAENFLAAIQDYDVVIDGGGVNEEIFLRRSEAYLKLGEFPKAIDDTLSAENADDSSLVLQERLIGLHELHAIQLLKSGDYNESIQAYSVTLAFIDDDTPQCDTDNGGPNVQTGAVSTSNDCRIIARLRTGYVHALVARGEKRLSEGDSTQAYVDFSKAIEIDPAQIVPHLLSALIDEEIGNRTRAISHFNAVINLDPDNQDALVGLERLRSNSENLTRLIQVELKRIGCDPGPIDGRWGQKGQLALVSIANSSDEAVRRHANDNPSETLLGVLQAVDEQMCQQSEAPPVPQPTRDASCFTFNLQEYCE